MLFSFPAVLAVRSVLLDTRESLELSVPARDLKGRAENLIFVVIWRWLVGGEECVTMVVMKLAGGSRD
jgi:hypothetical protein